MANQRELLARDSLTGLSLGISVSESADLGRLGLLDTHLRLALAEASRAMLIGGARIVYGGHLDPDGYTAFLRAEMEKYSRRDQPLTVCLAWQEHRRIPLADLAAAEDALSLYGRIVYLSAGGEEIPRDYERAEPAEPVEDPELRRKALTALREYMIDRTEARVLFGGKRTGFQGRYPGVLEEALLSIKAGRPLFLASGFGGVTLDIARTLGLDPDGYFAALAASEGQNDGLAEGLALIEMAALDAGWRFDQNGLSRDENLRLAASHRPSEVASLVALGLGRTSSGNGISQ